ncbi:PRLI-interacting factor, putative [Theobroma cacao]|uniref:PRLI-interacting factor, putative n=1 Tax=Theobroma cacao TaxID=3641 RepID=A0A061GTC1_THECC|nr:PRLI-interacting factor, putative [Theobroma cacao]
MNDQSQMMNQPPQMMMNSVQVQVPVQPQMMNQSHQLMAAAAAAHSQAMNQLAAAQAQSQPMSSGPQMMNQPPRPMMLNRSYKPWQSQDPNPNPNLSKKFPSFNRNNNWKGKKVTAGKDSRKFDNKPLPMASVSAISSVSAASGSSTQGYKPPTLNELQSQNRLKARKFYGNKKKFNNNNNRFAPYAPRNTTSFIIRAKKSGGIASLVSPCPVTPAVLPTPIFSPSREVLGDMAKEEWGVDGYGSMKGLIRLRSPEVGHDYEEDEDGGNGGGSSESDVEEHVEVERRLDHDLSRFEMIYPSYGGDYNNVLENRVDDQDTHIAQLEEENLTLKERLFLMERELADLRRRLQFLERQSQVVEDVNEEVVENGSDNESEGGGSDVRLVTGAADHNNAHMVELTAGKSRNVDVMEEDNSSEMPQNEGLRDASTDEIGAEDDVAREGELKKEGRRDDELKGQALREEIFRDKENEVKGDEPGGSEFVGEKIVEEEKNESRCEEARNESADNNETRNKEVHS